MKEIKIPIEAAVDLASNVQDAVNAQIADRVGGKWQFILLLVPIGDTQETPTMITSTEGGIETVHSALHGALNAIHNQLGIPDHLGGVQ